MSSLMIGITTWLLELRCVCTLVNSSLDPSVKLKSLSGWAVSKGQRVLANKCSAYATSIVSKPIYINAVHMLPA